MPISLKNTTEPSTLWLSAQRLIHTSQRLILISTGVPAIQGDMAVRLVSMTVESLTPSTLSETSNPVGIARMDRMIAPNQTEDG
jgi:hypothetical protein